MRTLHAGRVAISVNGTTIGRMTGISPQQDFGISDQYEVGSIFPFEEVPLRFSGSFTAARFLVEKAAMSQAGIPIGNTDGECESAIQSLLTTDGVDLTVIEKATGTALLTILGAKCSSFSITITANAVIVSNATFKFGSKGPMRMGDVPETPTGYTLTPPVK